MRNRRAFFFRPIPIDFKMLAQCGVIGSYNNYVKLEQAVCLFSQVETGCENSVVHLLQLVRIQQYCMIQYAWKIVFFEVVDRNMQSSSLEKFLICSHY